jgi:hypothetical protein
MGWPALTSGGRLALGVLLAALLVLAVTAAPRAASAESHDLPATGSGELSAAAPRTERLNAAEATRAANLDSKVREERRLHPDLSANAELVNGVWEVGYSSDGEKVALVMVDPASGDVRESWTGYQVAWQMARGYSGSFGQKLNAPYVFLPLCALFLAGLLDWRRPWRIANLDLLVLLGFGVSNFFFNRAEIGVSVPLAYPPLIYLFARALWIGLRGRGEGIRPVWPTAWLIVLALFLLGFRAGLNVADSGVIDVGYASVVGGDRISHGEAVYDNFPADVSQGDTYGPATYLSYVPFEAVWPWHGDWDDLPAAHGAAVLFDVATCALLFLLGCRMRRGDPGLRLGATLAFGWAAYPYTAYTLASNSNDTLVALALVVVLLLISRPALRGASLAFAALTKFAPVLLAPMLLTYPAARAHDRETDGESSPRPGARRFVLGFAVAASLLLLWPAIDPGLATVWDRTIGYQAGRDSPFSIWGQAPGLEPLRIAILAGVAALSIALAFRPRFKTLTQVAALGAALLIGAQLTMQHWFYLYIVWFYPLLLVAFASDRGSGGPQNGLYLFGNPSTASRSLATEMVE